MKVKNSLRSLKNRHRDCRVVRRKAAFTWSTRLSVGSSPPGLRLPHVGRQKAAPFGARFFSFPGRRGRPHFRPINSVFICTRREIGYLINSVGHSAPHPKTTRDPRCDRF